MSDGTYRAAVCVELSGPSAVELRDVERRVLEPGEIRVRTAASGVNFPDYLLTRGEYQLLLDPPFVAGMEVAGVVSEIGPGVGHWEVGDRVIAVGRSGGFAEEMIAGAGEVFALPDELSFAEGATLLVASRTAYHALVERGGLVADETVLVLGAPGGVGLAAVQVASILGATVIGVGSGDARLRVVAGRGAHHVLDHRRVDLVETIRELVPSGVDVIVDPVDGDMAVQANRLLGWGGRHLVVGFASGNIPFFAANRLLLKSASVIGVRAGEAGRLDPRRHRLSVESLLAWAKAGLLRPHIAQQYTLERTADALSALADRQIVGRIAITNGAVDGL